MPCASIEAILDELGQSFARVGLTQREPADELERVVNPHPPLLDVALATLFLARLLRHARLSTNVSILPSASAIRSSG